MGVINNSGLYIDVEDVLVRDKTNLIGKEIKDLMHRQNSAKSVCVSE